MKKKQKTHLVAPTRAERAAYVRGAKDAASLASEYDGSSSHKFRLEDCILGKMNLTSRLRARANKKAANVWIRGYGTALAEVSRLFRGGNAIVRAAFAAGLTLARFRASGLSDYDLDELKRSLAK